MSDLTLVIGNKNYSSWSLRPWLAMKQAGLAFEEIRIALYRPESRDRVLRYSPTGKVPVLRHGEWVIWESLAICEYIAEQFAPQLYPSDPALKAIARSVSHEMHAGFAVLREQMPMNVRERIELAQIKSHLKTDIDRICQIWRDCRVNYGQGGDFLFGTFTIADAMYAPVVSRFITYQVKLGSVERAYLEAIWQLPALQNWVAAAEQETETLAFPYPQIFRP
jgi:glutathione S-transferase